MNKYSSIDPEFLSENSEDGLDFVKYITYLTTLEARLPQMVAEITEGGQFHKERFEQHFLPIKCNLGRKYLIYSVAMTLLKQLANIDLMPYYLQTDADYPAGKGINVIAQAHNHRTTAHEAQALIKALQEALSRSRQIVDVQLSTNAAATTTPQPQQEPQQERSLTKEEVEKAVALEHKMEEQAKEETDPNTLCVRAIHAMGVPQKKAEEIVERYNELGSKEELCLYVDEELVSLQPKCVISEQQAVSTQWARATYRAVKYTTITNPGSKRNLMRDYFNEKNGIIKKKKKKVN